MLAGKGVESSGLPSYFPFNGNVEQDIEVLVQFRHTAVGNPSSTIGLSIDIPSEFFLSPIKLENVELVFGSAS